MNITMDNHARLSMVFFGEGWLRPSCPHLFASLGRVYSTRQSQSGYKGGVD